MARVKTIQSVIDRDSFKTYKIDDKKIKQISSLVNHANRTMTSPIAYHFCCHISDAGSFAKVKSDLIKHITRSIRRQYKPTNEPVPTMLMFHSVEFKYTTQEEIDGATHADVLDAVMSANKPVKLPYLHMHLYVIADMNKANRTTFTNKVLPALNSIAGLRGSKYFKSKYDDKKYIKIKDDVQDAIRRMSYLAKIEQKSIHIPFTKTWGISRIVRQQQPSILRLMWEMIVFKVKHLLFNDLAMV